MNDEMVNRLRLWAENMHGQKSSVIAVVMAEAADEIERLRKERDDAKSRLVRALSLIQEYEAREQ